jgi:dTDP-4-amino-4,6-dideoxygalactose transaminase
MRSATPSRWSPTGRCARGGLVPVFVDVDPRTFTLDPERARAAVTDRTVAIMPVHMMGMMADMSPIWRLAREYGLLVVEDAAQAHGASYQDAATGQVWPAGGAGDLAGFSLSDVKNIGSLGQDAGLLAVSESARARYPGITDLLRAWRNTGRTGKHRYMHDEWGVRARMDEYAAIEILDELEHLEEWNARRRAIAARYDAALAGTPFAAPHVPPGRGHAYFAYMVTSPSVPARIEFERRLLAAGIEVTNAYADVADQPKYRSGQLACRIGEHEVARRLTSLLIPIPVYPELEEGQIQLIEGVLADAPAA